MVYVVLENVGLNKKFKAKNNVMLSYSKDNSVSQYPAPEVPESETPLIKFAGVLSKWTISFDLITDTEDLSMGTHTPAVRTVWEQIQYLTDYFVTDKVNEKHRVIIPGVLSGGGNFVKEGAFSRISIDFMSGEGEKAKANIDLNIGKV